MIFEKRLVRISRHDTLLARTYSAAIHNNHFFQTQYAPDVDRRGLCRTGLIVIII